MKIWKYPLTMNGMTDVLIPRGARILTVQTQENLPCLWALVRPNNENEIRTFRIFATGHEIYNHRGLRYIGTFQLFDGKEVYHLFEIMEKGGFPGGEKQC